MNEPKEVNAAPVARLPQAPGFPALLFITILYPLLGWLGLALAVPPGYASPVFPAAGFALAVTLFYGTRTLPALWLGSLSLNISVALLHGNLSLSALLAASGIATGATLQAWVGQHLIHKCLKPEAHKLDQEKYILGFLATGGAMACLISASLGIATLVTAGIIPSTAAGHSWWNWYIGDTLGVFITAPLVLGLLQREDSHWRSRLKVIAPPVCGMLIIAVLMFIGAANWEKTRQQARIDDQGRILVQALEHRFISHHEMLSSLARLIEVTPDLNLSQFDYFTKTVLRDQPDLFALSFNPYVPRERRAELEDKMARFYPGEKFGITERDANRKLIRAKDRPEYVPVGFISPLQGNLPAIGFDINSEPNRRDAISRARLSGKPAATAPIKLVQEAQERVGVLVMSPAFTPAPPGHALAGFAVAVIKVDQMIDIAIHDKLTPGLIVEIEDPAAGENSRLLYRSNKSGTAAGQDTVWQARLRMADRDWTLRVIPTNAYLEAYRPWLAWGVGVAGLLFAALLQILLLGVTGRTALIQRRVEEQTEEIRTAMQAAEAANLAKGQFLATVSHELRTPMNGILGMAQLLQMSSYDENTQRKYIQTILESGKILLNLLNDILDFSKIDAGKLELIQADFDPEKLLKETASLFHGNAAEKGLELALAWESGPQNYIADPQRIRQMLSNLTNNAIKFTPQGKIHLRGKEIERTPDSALLEFSVTDTGIGIEKSKLAQLFKPFTQADSTITRQFGGTGLGLSIVHSLALNMGGEAGAESEPGQGSRFWFRVRARPVAESQRNEFNKRPGAAGPILLVGGSLSDQRICQALLGKLGLNSLVAQDEMSALKALQETPSIPLILLAIQQSSMDACKISEKIRNWERQSPAACRKIIALTEEPSEESQRQWFEAGMDDYLIKPLRLDDLQALLKKHLPSEQS